MKSQRQSREMTSISRGAADPASGTGGSRSCDPVHAIPPRNRTIRAGMDQIIISIRPEYSHSGRYRARAFLARNHQANTRVSTITGMTTASMIAVESRRMTRSALPTGPCGSRTPSLHDAVNIAALAIETPRSHTAGALAALVTCGRVRARLAACITDSIGIHWCGWSWREILCKCHALPNPPNGGLTRLQNTSPIEGMVRELAPPHDRSRRTTHEYYFALQPAGFSEGSCARSYRR